MSLSDRLTRVPRPFDPAIGAEAVAVTGLTGSAADLIAGAAGCSPYLAGLIAREAAWLHDALDDPGAATEACLADLPDTCLADLPVALRQAKRRLALITALADLGGVWPLETVTDILTRLADTALQAGIVPLVAAEIARGRLPGLGPDDAETAGGMVVLAMGKMGASELNYSSDIDLICLFDDTRFAPVDIADARAAFVRVTRKLMSLIADITADGYVFRTDLRLRPDASVTPVCLSMAAAENYYESVGRTWERAAFIKARACAGDIAAGERFLAGLRPFVWRRHLDFAAIEDAHDMRLRIRAHKGLGGAFVLDGHDMKLGRGGIREIEFFAQTRQLIAGGRAPALRVRGTVPALAALAATDWIGADVATALTDHYRAHREVEHRVQMIHDAQTHRLPVNAEGFDRLAAFMDTGVADLRTALTDRIMAVDALTEPFFAPGTPVRKGAEPAAGTSGDDTFGARTMARWHSYPALRSERAVAIFRRLRPDLARRLSAAPRPDEALDVFDAFVAGLPAGVQLFSLFEANPALTQLIVDIAATAPALADYLSHHSGVLDAVIGGGFFADWPGQAALSEELAALLVRAGDHEAQLDAARRWQKDWHFRIGVHHLRGLIGPDEAGAQYADLAQAVVAGLWPVASAQVAARHGPPPGRGAAVVGMGSLGAGRLNAASDLDLIVIYDAAGETASTGKRPIAPTPYYAKLTQALITALTVPTSEGRLYEVDMRLRPSGRQGPVATSLTAFIDYQRDTAWTWEHLALTRARPVAGDAEVQRDVEAARRTILREKSDGPTVLTDVVEMRARVHVARPGGGIWEAKAGPGRLQDIELAAQMLALRTGAPVRDTQGQIAAGVDGGLIDAARASVLTDAWQVFAALQSAARLLNGDGMDVGALCEGGRRVVLRDCAAPGAQALAADLAAKGSAAAEIIDRLLEDDR